MSDSTEKPVPNLDKPMAAMDANRTSHANLAPQGAVDLSDEVPDSNFTPEGDHERVPNIPPSATDPA
jgi:hypothetical protein